MTTPALRNATLVFLIKNQGERVTDVCLAMKKRGFGEGRWNGVGGKVENAETVEQGAYREAREEVGVQVEELKKVAELEFRFPHNPKFDQRVHAYVCSKWSGEAAETEEMRPEWFAVETIPYSKMWSDDILWLPQVLKGEFLKGKVLFDDKDGVASCELAVTGRWMRPEATGLQGVL